MTDLERDAELMALAVRYDQSRHWCRAAIGLFLGSAVILSAVWIRLQWFGAAEALPRKPPTPQVQVQQFEPGAASAPLQRSRGS
jgi:hypothetical protein